MLIHGKRMMHIIIKIGNGMKPKCGNFKDQV